VVRDAAATARLQPAERRGRGEPSWSRT